MRANFLFAMAAIGLGGALLRLCIAPGPAHPGLVAPWMHRLDTSGDGRIDALEYARGARHPQDFELFDADHDGRLSPAELEVLLFRVDPAWSEAPPA